MHVNMTSTLKRCFQSLFSLLIQELLQTVLDMTEGYEVNQLEKLYALLCQSIYRHRKDYDKTALIQVHLDDARICPAALLTQYSADCTVL